MNRRKNTSLFKVVLISSLLELEIDTQHFSKSTMFKRFPQTIAAITQSESYSENSINEAGVMVNRTLDISFLRARIKFC